ncbi:MAG: BamA/TamA family outer membrane protein [Acidobacteriota bacterium]|nr:BamA/TamA family outer membrane protein [Acidobacteriota bacterium]
MAGCPPLYSRDWVVAGLTLVLAFGLAATAIAQQGQPAPQDVPPVPELGEPQGFIPEPAVVERAAVFADRNLSGGGQSNGFYVSTKSPIQGSGWISVGPGYRHWFRDDRVFIDGSAGVSWRGYKVAQAQLEFPKLLRSRLVLGSMYRWQDFRSIKSYGAGPNTAEADVSTYHLSSQNVVGYATVRIQRWLNLNSSLGWVNPEVRSIGGDEPRFMHAETSLVADTRDYPDHPTSGALVRVAGARFDDQDTGLYSFQRFESEAAAFIPLADSRIVVALRGWLVASDSDAGQSVPGYLQPTLGGSQSLRSYPHFRFRDDHMLVGNLEVRVALMTHIDAVAFADAGNVAPRLGDLNLDKRSYGGGLRFHTRRATILRAEAANGREGWRVMFSMSEPLSLSRTERRTAPFPFVP